MSVREQSVSAIGADAPTVDRAASRAEYRWSAVQAERRTWLVVWCAFATFLLLLGSGVKLAADYVSSAHVDLLAHVESSRGLVLADLVDGAGTVLRSPEVAVGTTLAPTRAASVSLRLFDRSLITALTGSQVQLVRMDVGRFNGTPTIWTRQSQGAVRYETRESVRVDVPGGTLSLTAGDYTIWVQNGLTHVRVYGGTARLQASGGTVDVTAAQRGSIATDGRIQGPLPRQVDLLANGDFSHGLAGWQPLDAMDGPRDVAGQRTMVPGPLIDGQETSALHIVRQSVALAHGETGVFQPLNQEVTGFRHLWVDAWIKVTSASLSGGGQLGSEYPLMLRVQYEGLLEGSQPDWVRGFFATNPEDRPIRNGEQVPADAWRHYRVDLMAVDESRLPFLVKDLTVMGQGHSYDSSAAEIHLYGD